MTINQYAQRTDINSQSPPLLSIQNLSVTLRAAHGHSVEVVRNVSFTLERGKVLAILGESGSGKTMTIKGILRLLPPKARTEGEVLFSGQNLLDLPEAAMAKLRGDRIAMIFQDPMSSLDPVYTIGTQICEVIQRHRGLNEFDARRQAIEDLGSLGIADPEMRMSDYPHQLSGGMCQRVMIAMALACQPEILLADEPTSALDVTVQAQILNILDGLRTNLGLGLVLVTHDVGVAAALADEVAVMYAGELVESGPVAQVLHNPRHPYTAGLIEANVGSDHTGPLQPIPGQPPELSNLPPGCAFADRCAYAIESCYERRQELRPLGFDSGRAVRCQRVEEEGLILASQAIAGGPTRTPVDLETAWGKGD
jgi:oligopeptide/dipeptide ABC transporter ATP-binding protein